MPSVYFRLKSLNEYEIDIPKDLENFLSEIYNVNVERNRLIIDQMTLISNLFEEKNIDHVFLKGSALIALNINNMQKERMVGDIDILINPKDIDNANQLLIKNGYKINVSSEKYLTQGIYTRKHLDRLTNTNFIAAVELHNELLNHNFTNLLPKYKVLKHKIKVKNFWIPSKEILWEHAILNWQINDMGFNYNYISFKTIIDVLNFEPTNISKKLQSESSYIKHFYSMMNVHFDSYPVHFPLGRLIYLMQINLRPISILIKLFLRSYFSFKLLINRTILILTSKKYLFRIVSNPIIFFKKIKNFLK